MNDGLPADDCVIVIVGGMGPMAGLKCFEYVMSNSITNGTASPLNRVFLIRSAIRIPMMIPPKYSAIITIAPCFGKNAAVKKA